MFQGLFKRAENKIDSVLAKYLGRALVAVPLLVAAGFATAALTVKAVEIYGTVTGYAMMAALFAVIGLVTMAIVGIEQRREAEPETAAQADTASTEAEQAEAGIDPMDLLTPEVRAMLASTAPMALPGLVRGVGRNLPLILFLALIGFIISRFGESAASASSHEPGAADGNGDNPDIEATVTAAAEAAAA